MADVDREQLHNTTLRTLCTVGDCVSVDPAPAGIPGAHRLHSSPVNDDEHPAVAPVNGMPAPTALLFRLRSG
jgi:hypothetical protein